MILLLALGCANPHPRWFGTVSRDGEPALGWEGNPVGSYATWDGTLDRWLFGASGWIHDPELGPLFATAGFEVYMQNGTVEPPNTSQPIPILSFVDDTRDHDWWVYATWIEQDPEGEVAMRYVYNGSGGRASGSLVIDGLFTDPRTEALGFTGHVDLQIDQDASEAEPAGTPMQRDIEYTFFWGTVPAGAIDAARP